MQGSEGRGGERFGATQIDHYRCDGTPQLPARQSRALRVCNNLLPHGAIRARCNNSSRLREHRPTSAATRPSFCRYDALHDFRPNRWASQMSDKLGDKHKILVVDDDQRLRDLLTRYLTEQGFAVQTAINGPAMDRLLNRELFDLIVLDLMLPGEDGLAICRRLRGAANKTPIIMLTAKGEDVDRIIGLEMGADDYLPKPFNPRELVARIHAVLRRIAEAGPPGAPLGEAKEVTFGAYHLNLATRALTRDGAQLALTTGEFSVLKVLVQNARTPLSRDKLMELARGREYEVFDRAIDVQISRLRKLLEADPQNPKFIQTVWGFGYVFVPEA